MRFVLGVLISTVAFAQPGAPLHIAANPMSDGTCGVQWARADDTDTGNSIGRATSSAGTYTYEPLRGYHQNIMVDKSLYPATQGWYKFQASNGGGTATSSVIDTTSTGAIAKGANQVITPGAMGGIATGVPVTIDDGTFVNTTYAGTVASGVLTVTPVSMANILSGNQLLIDSVASGVQETITVTSVTGSTFTATFAKSHTTNPLPITGVMREIVVPSATTGSTFTATTIYAHSSGAPINSGACTPFPDQSNSLGPLTSFAASGVNPWTVLLSWSMPVVNTTASPTISAGPQTVTPANMANISVNQWLTVDTSTSGKQETVQVTATTGTTFTATYLNSHTTASIPIVDSYQGYIVVQRSTDGIWFHEIASLNAVNGPTTLNDPDIYNCLPSPYDGWGCAPLTPGATVYYRARVVGSNDNYTAWTPTQSVTLASRPGGGAMEPTNPTAVVNSATSTTISWTDTNSGAKAYCIETAPYNNEISPSWTQALVTAAGATSGTLTTVAETFYYVRVRADCNGTPSGYTVIMRVRSASPTVGGGNNSYTICPSGCTYTSIGASPVEHGLGPGDTVTIGPGTFNTKWIISNRGTAASPITINCLAGTVFDGTLATNTALMDAVGTTLSDGGLIIITRTAPTAPTAWSPGYLTLHGCGAQNAVNGATYNLNSGGTRTYVHPIGIWNFTSDHVTIDGNMVTGNSEGIFSAGNNDGKNVQFNTYSGDTVNQNGEPGGTLFHNMYIEEQYPVITNMNLGPPKSSGYGDDLKDRSCGTRASYNTLTPANNYDMNWGESQNYGAQNLSCPDYDSPAAWGNLFNENNNRGTTNSTATLFNFSGGFLSAARSYNAAARVGPLKAYQNTFSVVEYSGSVAKYFTIVFLQPYSTVDFRNNIVYGAQGTGSAAPNLILSDTFNYKAFSYVNSGIWYTSPIKYCNIFQTCTGFVGNSSAINTSGSVNFVSPSTGNFSLGSGSAAIGIGGLLGSNWPAVSLQSFALTSTITRSTIVDAGYQQYTTTPTATTPTFSPVSGTYATAQNITISADVGDTIVYTSDGSTPTVNSSCVATHGTTYGGPVNVASNLTLSAVACQSGYITSAVGTAAYVIASPFVANPSFSLAAGSYVGAHTTTITTTTPSAVICLTEDGTTPTGTNGVCLHGFTYSGPISILSSVTIRAIGTLAGSTNSAVVSSIYTITIPARPMRSSASPVGIGVQ
jgi:hypothetical protein